MVSSVLSCRARNTWRDEQRDNMVHARAIGVGSRGWRHFLKLQL
jgi:hypothetical protein